MARANMTTTRGIRKSAKVASFILAINVLVTAVSLLPSQYVSAQENPDETFTINLKNVDIHTLIETVSIRTGINFIVDPRVKATVNVVSPEPVNADKLYEIFLSVLQVHGYAAVQVGQLTKIVPSSVGVQNAVPLVNEPSDTEDELVSQVIYLQSAVAVEVVETLRPLIPESASLSAESTSNTIVVTDRAANIDKLIELITLLDGQ
ncbi:hypothetical protein OAM69_04360 [bacterium]|nr:hypothetical protein [bacterium]